MQRPVSTPTDKARTPETEDPHRPRRPHALDVSIGMALRYRRQLLGLSQQSLAEKCGLSFQQIQKYESGANRIPASRLFFLASSLETTPTELLSSAWKGEIADRDNLLRTRLENAVAFLSGEQLQALVTLAESLTGARPDPGA